MYVFEYLIDGEENYIIEDFSGGKWYPSSSINENIEKLKFEQCKRHFRNKLMRKKEMTIGKATYLASKVAGKLYNDVEVVIL